MKLIALHLIWISHRYFFKLNFTTLVEHGMFFCNGGTPSRIKTIQNPITNKKCSWQVVVYKNANFAQCALNGFVQGRQITHIHVLLFCYSDWVLAYWSSRHITLKYSGMSLHRFCLILREMVGTFINFCFLAQLTVTAFPLFYILPKTSLVASNITLRWVTYCARNGRCQWFQGWISVPDLEINITQCISMRKHNTIFSNYSLQRNNVRF